jgi:hypothetical protein
MTEMMEFFRESGSKGGKIGGSKGGKAAAAKLTKKQRGRAGQESSSGFGLGAVKEGEGQGRVVSSICLR